MRSISKDLLQLEQKNASASAIESALLVCGKKDPVTHNPNSGRKPSISPLPKSQVLGKVKDFLGVISEANRRLEHDAKENSDAYDIEVISGNESSVIEMDLMLGIADLNNPEAVAAAESAIAGYQPLIPLAASSSETESDDSHDSSDSTNNDEESASDDDEKQGTAKLEKIDSSSNGPRKKQSNKRQKIIELS